MVVQDLDAINFGLFGYAIRLAADRSGDVRAVAVSVSVLPVDETLEKLGTPLKLLLRVSEDSMGLPWKQHECTTRPIASRQIGKRTG